MGGFEEKKKYGRSYISPTAKRHRWSDSTGICRRVFASATYHKGQGPLLAGIVAGMFLALHINPTRDGRKSYGIICPFAKGGSQLPRPGIGLALMNPGHEIGFGAGWGYVFNNWRAYLTPYYFYPNTETAPPGTVPPKIHHH